MKHKIQHMTVFSITIIILTLILPSKVIDFRHMHFICMAFKSIFLSLRKSEIDKTLKWAIIKTGCETVYYD